jgi:hypothetical protein
MKLISLMASAALAVSLATAASAATPILVDISGASDVGTTVNLAAGTYNVSFIDNTAAGGFNGFSFWSNTSGCASSSNCAQGFTELFEVVDGGSTTQFIKLDSSTVNGYNIYDTAADALAGYQAGGVSEIVDGVNEGQSTRFTLTAPTSLNFVIQDSYYPDNRGGVSIALSAVPEPSTWAMMLVGFGGLGAAMRGARRRQTAIA